MPQRSRRPAGRRCAALLAASGLLLAGSVLPAAAGPFGAVARPPAGPAAENPVVWSVRPTPVDGQAERSNFTFSLRPNQRVEDSIRIRNFGRNPLRLEVYAADARTTDNGAVDLLPSGQPSKRVGTWVSVQRRSVELTPGELVDVAFTLTVPDNAESGDHTGGIVTALRSPAAGGREVSVEQRLASLVQVRVDGPLRPAVAVTSLSADYKGTANPFGKGEVVVTWTATNTGNVRMGAQQAVRTSGPFGLDDERIFLDPMPELLPGDSFTTSARVPGVAPTIRSSVEVELRPLATRAGDEFGAEVAIAKRSTGTWSIPWVLLVLLLFFMAAPAVAIWQFPQVVRRRTTAEPSVASKAS